ncbi:MAG: hypothetical protein U0103_11580 [Candidatus Obscuribacterales bacterium]
MPVSFTLMVDDTSKGSGIDNLLSIPGAIAEIVSPDATKSHEEAAFLGVATILIILFWTKFAPKKLKMVPSFLVAIAIVSTIAAVFTFRFATSICLPIFSLACSFLMQIPSCI